ncbi:RICIN domain-containing protein [Kitasatospora terrestris]|uniref:Ricin B lectin domain-containing protein n=1 Tax=Kitasatospora terrestris TaxID=258051 RepID=A0ABP9D508_9ACTN
MKNKVSRVLTVAGALASALALGTVNAGTASAYTWDEIYSYGAGVCLTPYGGSTSNGANIVQWRCDTVTNITAHNWSWDEIPGGYQVRNRNSNKCITLYGGSTANGTYLTQWDCNGSAAQKWYMGGYSGNYTINHAGSGKCMTSKGGDQSSSGVVMTLWDCNGSPAQRWFLGDIQS